MQALTILKKFFSVDMVIYAAIVIVAATALLRCTLPLSRIAAKLRRAARTIVTESKQNKEKKSWNDMHFLGDSLSATWADFLQNAEMRDAHGRNLRRDAVHQRGHGDLCAGEHGFRGACAGRDDFAGHPRHVPRSGDGPVRPESDGRGYRSRADGDGSAHPRHEHGVPDLHCGRVRFVAV